MKEINIKINKKENLSWLKHQADAQSKGYLETEAHTHVTHDALGSRRLRKKTVQKMH